MLSAFINIAVPPSVSLLDTCKANPLSVGDFLYLRCRTDSSNPIATLWLNSTENTKVWLVHDTYNDTSTNAKSVQVRSAEVVGKQHNGLNVECNIYYMGSHVDQLTKAYKLNVTCE